MEQYHLQKQNAPWRSIPGFVISAALLWLTFYKSGLRLNDIQLHGEQFCYFAGAIVVLVFSFWLYSIRAKLIWQNGTKQNASIQTYDSFIIGNFYNSILPGNLGEGVRAWHFSRKNKLPFTRSLAAIITEKWLDAQVFAVLVIVFFLLKPFAPHYIYYALGNTALAVFILSVVYIIMGKNIRIEKTFWHIVLRFGKAGKVLYKMYSHTGSHLRNMRQHSSMWKYLVLFMLIFVLNGLQFFLLQKAAGIPAPIAGMYSSFLISLSMMIIAFVPSAPGNIGVLHYGVYSAMILAAQQYAIAPDVKNLQSYALFGVYVHLSYFIPEVLMGIVFVVKGKKFLFGSAHMKPR